MDRHWGEHLGWSIAYARSNGVVSTSGRRVEQQKPADKPERQAPRAERAPEKYHIRHDPRRSGSDGVQQ